jgi:hypothetical protein
MNKKRVVTRQLFFIEVLINYYGCAKLLRGPPVANTASILDF